YFRKPFMAKYPNTQPVKIYIEIIIYYFMLFYQSRKRYDWILVLALLLLMLWPVQPALGQINIIPKPAHINVGNGHFIIDKQTSVHIDDEEEMADLGDYFSTRIKEISGIELPVNKSTEKNIHLRLVNTDTLKAEGYKLIVRPSAIDIEASDEAGLFYGIQSILQTLPVIRTNEVLKIPAMEVVDQPRLSWRGMMLDVSRHFYSTE